MVQVQRASGTLTTIIGAPPMSLKAGRETVVRMEDFWNEVEGRISRYDLLCHPFYQAWSAGQLTRAELREYAAQYYLHVAAFPTYLSAVHARLPAGELRRAALRNLCEEEIAGRSHSDLWLDFAEGLGADREEVARQVPLQEVRDLIGTYRRFATEEPVFVAVAAFYAYESQVPRVAREKARGLRELYAADAKTCRCFTLHTTADVRHAAVWRACLDETLQAGPGLSGTALRGAEEASLALWHALDGIERQRKSARA